MTHSIDTPFPPPPAESGASAGATTTSSSGTSGSASTTDVAKDEARNVGQTAAQAGSQVASTAADQAREVAYETKQQAQDLVQQGRAQLRQQAVGQQHKAAEGLSSLAQQLRGMVQGNAPAPGPARDLIEQATGRVEEFAGWLQNREPADLLDEVRSFARRKPGTFLLGAALAGVLAGRLTSGVKAAHSSSGSGGSGTSGTYQRATYVDTTPAYSGYDEPGGYATTGTTTTGTYGAGTTGTYGAGTTPVPPPPYGTVPPEDSTIPPTTPAGWDDPTRRPGTGV